MRGRSEEVDLFGRDPIFEDRLQPLFDFLYHKYWRIQTTGMENIPYEGRALLVGNHSGTLPYDGAMMKVAIFNEHPIRRDVRFLVEDFAFHFPFIGTFLNRIGGVRACQENAERLLGNEQLVVVFPEGVKGIGKYYRNRYKLQRFGRGGFIRLCMRTRSPIIPVAIVGAEEIHPLVGKLDWIGKFFGFPYIPLTLTFPWLGPLGAVPFPSKWFIHFGEPIDIGGKYGPDRVDDNLLVNKLSMMVRTTIQEMIYELLKKRTSVWFG